MMIKDLQEYKEMKLEKDKWIKHYSSNHEILLVGEGDFSFALSLAIAFGSAYNITVSSLDTYHVVLKKYKEATRNLNMLSSFGATLLQGVDATKMELHHYLRTRKFDRIVFNFPHAGYFGKENDPLVIMMHTNLVSGFFRNASSMLKPNGEVHVTHKTTYPFNLWNIEELASQSSLKLVECVKFKINDYPGYNNKRGGKRERGSGWKPDDPFPLGRCSTFKFARSSTKKSSTSIFFGTEGVQCMLLGSLLGLLLGGLIGLSLLGGLLGLFICWVYCLFL